MSEVRQCDSCKRIFSLLEDDWARSVNNLRHRNPNTGRVTVEEMETHTCGTCVKKAFSPSKTPEDYVKELEKENGIPPLPDVKD